MIAESNVTPPQDTLKTDSSLIRWLLQIILALLAELQALRAKLAAFEKDSTTSHKPPSSDGLGKNVAPLSAALRAESRADKKGIGASRAETFRPTK